MPDKIPDGFIPMDAVPEGFVPMSSLTEDVAKSARAGLATGVAGIVGGAGDAQSLLQRYNPFDWLAKKYEEAYPERAAANKALAERTGRTSDIGEIKLPTTEQVKGFTGEHFGPALEAAGLGHQANLSDLVKGGGGGFKWDDYEPQTTLGRYAKTGAEFVPGAALGGARTVGQGLANLTRYAVVPGAAVQATGDLAEGIDPRYKAGAQTAAALLATVLAGKGISFNAARGPEASRLNHAANVARLEEEGIPVSAGERADKKSLRQAEDELNPEGYKAKLEAVTRAATRVVPGFETPVITREGTNYIDNLLHGTGRPFDQIAARNTLVPDAAMGVDLMNLRQHFSRNPNLFDQGVVNAVHGEADALRDALNTNLGRSTIINPVTGQPQPFITGVQYQRMRSSIARAARTTESPQRAEALHEFVNILDDAMERSIQRLNPADAGQWAQARRNYRNALVIEDAAKASNVAGAEGYITPAKLEAAAAKVYGRRAHERGFDPFDWAPAAKAVLKTEANSGTPGRLHVSDVINKITGASGAALGFGGGIAAGHGAGLSTEAAVAGLLLGKEGLAPFIEPIVRGGAEHLFHSRAGQAYLGNQVLGGEPLVGLPGLLNAAEAARQH